MDSGQEYDEYTTEFEDLEGLENFEYFDEDVGFREDISIPELYEECAKPTLYSASDQLCLLFISCLIFKIATQLLPVREVWCHVISVLCGIFSLWSLLGTNVLYTCVIGMLTYWPVLFCFRKTAKERSYQVVMICCFVYLVVREYFQVLPEHWDQIRGIHMIIVLKTVSLCYDVGAKGVTEPPPFINYLGYLFCPANIIFGPWMPFKTYCKIYERRRWAFSWVVKVISTTMFAFMCLGISSCWVYWLFLGIKTSWLLAARDAISVRFSHYFIAFMSEATCLLSGFHSTEDPEINMEVANPWKIELPRSLVEVVVYWDKPMHQWLKIHIFRALKNVGHLWRILLTFLVSSVLHGLNFSLSMVLLSLGFYTYVEYTLREKLASIFDACIKSRPCPPDCKHAFKSTCAAVMLLNLFFSLLAYFHLAYLGVMMDKKQDAPDLFTDGLSQQMARWSRLDYLSHWFVFVTYLFTILI
ncbi:unnamed protein product [Allacma fusca]|uniref:Protein-serine O-palmitoleoyltransferase porcupine n=1 Tax=Allacma fusca TaxID=39272 RepID=A0A8J2K7L3_9HEXA|nr:unnamed protein product [Allacma fusca]